MGAVDVDAVAAALRALTPPRFFCGARAIAAVPRHPQEACLYVDVDAHGDVGAARATATGRLLAREVLRNLGVVPGPLLREAGGAPAWPRGVSGSIAHSVDVAVCVVGAGVDSAVGVDVEAAVDLDVDVAARVVASDVEAAFVDGDARAATVLFCAKEAVFKALYPLERRFYEYSDVCVCGGFFVDDDGRFAPTVPRRFAMKTTSGATCNVWVTRHPVPMAVASDVKTSAFYIP